MPPPEPGTAAEEAVRSACGWHIAPSVTETVKVEGDGSRVLLLPTLHLTAVTEIRDEAGEVVSGYRIRENGIVRGRVWRNDELYSLDITHGYDAWPPELQEIIERLGDAAGTPGSIVQVGQVRYAVDPATGAPIAGRLTALDQAVLERYRLGVEP